MCVRPKDKELEYEPGDTIGIMCHNDQSEVSSLLDR